VAAVLEATAFTARMSPAVRSTLARIADVEDIPAQATLVVEGRRGDVLGVIVDGRIALRLAVPGGEHRTIMTIEAGDVFGWSALLPDAVATSTAETLVPTRVVLFDAAALRAAIFDDYVLGTAIYRRVLEAVARRLLATRLQLLDLYRPVAEPW